MTNEAKLPKTQAATLAEIKRIESSNEPAVELGVQRKGINLNALGPLKRKGLVRFHRVEGVATFVLAV